MMMFRNKHSRELKWLCVLSTALLIALPVRGASLNAKVFDPAGAPVGDVVIYALPKVGTRLPVIAPRSKTIEQKDREFVPYVTAVQVGTTVNFPNRDPVFHHVYSFSAAKNFEIRLYSGGSAPGILFDKPGTVILGCNIHDWMIGHIHIVETPYFGITGKDGSTLISDLVAGEYEINVWHPTQRVAVGAKPIRLEARTNIELEFTMDSVPRKKQLKPPPDAVRY